MKEMVTLFEGGTYLRGGVSLVAAEETERSGQASRADGKKRTLAYRILEKHNVSGDMGKLRIKFDMLASHDITYVGIIQTARASGLTKFPIPYVLTNCHNSLCAVGGTINEDDHMFGLTSAQKYGGIYVPPHQAVIHQYAREKMAAAGRMILGSDSHTRYGALGTMAVGEGGPELVKQLLGQTYDIDMPDVVGVYLTGEPVPGVGPQDVALAIIGAVFAKGVVKNKVMEFVGPGMANLSADFRIGIDVMTTETTCLTSIWQTDEKIREFYEIHGRAEDYQELVPGDMAYYDSMIQVDLSAVRPMIAMPFHPSNVYTIEELNANPDDILKETEERAKVSLGEDINLNLRAKLHNGRLLVEQGIIAGCAGGGFENICAAADILRGKYIGSGAFTLSLYPASTPIYMELVKTGFAADLLETGAILKTAFCGPCFGAGDTPANGAFSIRHSTRNFPNREGSKLQNGQISSVALMDARSIAATAANKGLLTPATEFTGSFGKYAYHYDPKIYDNRVYNSKGIAHPEVELQLGPNIKDWPQMAALPENLLLRVVCEIHDPVTTTDELIPSGETSSYRSNPMGLAEYTLSRKDPDYVSRAKEMKLAEDALLAGQDPWNASATLELDKLKPQIEKFLKDHQANASKETATERLDPVELAAVTERSEPAESAELAAVTEQSEPTVLTELLDSSNIGFGSLIFAVKPGDGSAREQAASCQKVLGGWANIANEYATKRYRSNLINWGILPFLIEEGDLPFHNLDYIWIPDIRTAVTQFRTDITAYRITESDMQPFTLRLGALTDKERTIITEGCLINYNRI